MKVQHCTEKCLCFVGSIDMGPVVIVLRSAVIAINVVEAVGFEPTVMCCVIVHCNLFGILANANLQLLESFYALELIFSNQ